MGAGYGAERRRPVAPVVPVPPSSNHSPSRRACEREQPFQNESYVMNRDESLRGARDRELVVYLFVLVEPVSRIQSRDRRISFLTPFFLDRAPEWQPCCAERGLAFLLFPVFTLQTTS